MLKTVITLDDLKDGSPLRKSLCKQFEGVAVSDPGTLLSGASLAASNLVLGPIGSSEDLSLFLQGVEGVSCPILLLIPENVALSVLLPKELLIDIQELPTNLKNLQQRIAFLSRVGQMIRQQHRQRISIDRQLDLLYTRDGLTGLYNRRHLNTLLADKFRNHMTPDKQMTTDKDFCLLILNIDYFNAINKGLGFEFGDAILNELAARLTERSRKNDICFRFSGEDFVILLEDTDLETGHREAERLRKECTEAPFCRGEKSRNLTLSGGLVSLRHHRPANHEEFICMMETALFVAKAEGRNRIASFAGQLKPEETGENSMTILRENLHRILEKTRRSAINSLRLLTRNVAGSEYENHIDQLTHFVNILGQEFGLSDGHLQTFQNAVTLYDSLRFLLHHDLLNKPAHLTEWEKRAMNDLPIKMEQLTEMFDYFSEEKSVLLSHGERYDGSGYPMGLRGDEIPLSSRIFTLANALAAMSSPRPFRPQLPPTKILEELVAEAGHQFDPKLVFKSLNALEKHGTFGLRPEFYQQLRKKFHSQFPHLEI